MKDDKSFRAFFDGETSALPEFFTKIIRNDLGPFWEALPPGALQHDPYMYERNSAGDGERDTAPEQDRAVI